MEKDYKGQTILFWIATNHFEKILLKRLKVSQTLKNVTIHSKNDHNITLKINHKTL